MLLPQLQYATLKGHRMNLIRFTFANIFDFKSVMDAIKPDYVNKYRPLDISAKLHASNSDNLQIVFRCNYHTNPIMCFVNNICTPINIEDLHE